MSDTGGGVRPPAELGRKVCTPSCISLLVEAQLFRSLLQTALSPIIHPSKYYGTTAGS